MDTVARVDFGVPCASASLSWNCSYYLLLAHLWISGLSTQLGYMDCVTRYALALGLATWPHIER
jgi:hypothetical protein